jgi:hypothetical protein
MAQQTEVCALNLLGLTQAIRSNHELNADLADVADWRGFFFAVTRVNPFHPLNPRSVFPLLA